MSAPKQNSLIQQVPLRDRERFLSQCESVELVPDQVLGTIGEPTRRIYFPVDGFISLLTLNEGKPSLEVGMVGGEGAFGAHLSLGVATQPFHALVQGAGTALCMTSRSFQAELQRSCALRGIMHRYLYVVMGQLASSAACLRFHQLGPRLARWLLMTQDRAHSRNFVVTHDYLAFMLGVRRVGITAAAGVLQRRGLIEYSRGHVTVLDRAALVTASCTCYAGDRRIYRSHLARRRVNRQAVRAAHPLAAARSR
jgi:CRP-like cAMP-binding protein